MPRRFRSGDEDKPRRLPAESELFERDRFRVARAYGFACSRAEPRRGTTDRVVPDRLLRAASRSPMERLDELPSSGRGQRLRADRHEADPRADGSVDGLVDRRRGCSTHREAGSRSDPEILRRRVSRRGCGGCCHCGSAAWDQSNNICRMFVWLLLA